LRARQYLPVVQPRNPVPVAVPPRSREQAEVLHRNREQAVVPPHNREPVIHTVLAESGRSQPGPLVQQGAAVRRTGWAELVR
jgi:hypothetical protein